MFFWENKKRKQAHKLCVPIFISSNAVCPDDKPFERLIYCTKSASAQTPREGIVVWAQS